MEGFSICTPLTGRHRVNPALLACWVCGLRTLVIGKPIIRAELCTSSHSGALFVTDVTRLRDTLRDNRPHGLHDIMTDLKIHIHLRLYVATVSQSHTNWESEPPCEVCCVRLSRREMCPGMIWNSILATPAYWAPTLTKNKIMKAGSRFVCFPKTLLASRITVFLHPPKYLRESGTEWTAANQFWVEF